MKIIIFTSNALRHKYVANRLAAVADEALVISECKPLESFIPLNQSSSLDEHFRLRLLTEKTFFSGNEVFFSPTVPLLYKEVNSSFVHDLVKFYQPDLAFVFGSAIIKSDLLSLVPRGRFINLHLGMSPYYRGSGTNFWPFVNNELEYIGSTILHIDAGVDTGDIIMHVRPDIELGDTVHTIGCKIIVESAEAMIRLMKYVKSDGKLPRVTQWQDSVARYYRSADFNEEILKKYYKNLSEGVVENYIKSPKKIRTIDFV